MSRCAPTKRSGGGGTSLLSGWELSLDCYFVNSCGALGLSRVTELSRVQEQKAKTITSLLIIPALLAERFF